MSNNNDGNSDTKWVVGGLVALGLMALTGLGIINLKSFNFGGFEFEPNRPTTQPPIIIIPGDSNQVLVVTATPLPPQTDSTVNDQATWESMGVNIYGGQQLDLNSLPPASSNQIYVFHGDILGENRCKIWVINPGGKPSDYNPSSSSWQLVRITGTSQQRETMLRRVEANAAADSSTGVCPKLN